MKCKENGYILIRKTGVRKTSLLNVIFDYEVGKVAIQQNQKQQNQIIV
jgi:predicted GTPase